MRPLVLTEKELRTAVQLDEDALSAVEEAFVWVTEGRARMPPVLHLDVADGRGDVDIKTAYVSGKDHFAVKIASGFFGNASRGLPTGSGLMIVLSAETGLCQAVLLDNGYLTDLRTGLAGAVAARHLAPAQVETAGVLGTGTQARYQIEALYRVRPFRRLMIHGRRPDAAAAYGKEMARRLGVEVTTADAEAVVRGSQCVVTATPATRPLLRADWLHPGLHITAMGSDLPGKQELEAEVLSRADLVACDARSQATKLGELQAVPASQAATAVELGEIITGRHPGRPGEAAVTVCDLTGMGTQDTAIALFALARARSRDRRRT